MKIKVFLVLLLVNSGINLYSQVNASIYDRIIKGNSASKGSNIMEFNIPVDINNDGINESFQGILLKKINANTYWIKNGNIVNKNDEVLVSFNDKIIVTGNKLIEQVSSIYGYVIEIHKNDNMNTLLVSIANQRGEKDSDELLINLKDTE